MGSIVQRQTAKGIAFQAHVARRGHARRVATFTSRTEAKKWIQRVEAAIQEHRDLPQREALRQTFAELVESFIKSEGYSTLSSGEQSKVAYQLGKWVEVLGERKVAELKSSVIDDARSKLKATGGRGRAVSSATLNRYMASISRCMAFAVERDLLSENPARSKKIKRGREKKRDRILTTDERDRLLEVCRADDPILYLLVVLALTTGGRQAELLRLRWKQVDLAPGGERITFVRTKNGEPRAVPLPPAAIEALRDLPRRIDGALFASETFPLQSWRRVLRLAKIDDFRFHDLRHCFSTILAENGASLTELKSALGHRTLQMVLRYANVAERAVEDSLRRRMTERAITFV